jgi:hypothetical protein
MLSLKNKILMTAAGIGLLSTGGYITTTHAQSTQAQQQQTNVSDAQLQEFAKARAAVFLVQEQFQGQAANITSQDEMVTLQQQANEQMVQAIQATDLNVEQYNQIASLVQADPQVQKRYMELAQ